MLVFEEIKFLTLKQGHGGILACASTTSRSSSHLSITSVVKFFPKHILLPHESLTVSNVSAVEQIDAFKSSWAILKSYSELFEWPTFGKKTLILSTLTSKNSWWELRPKWTTAVKKITDSTGCSSFYRNIRYFEKTKLKKLTQTIKRCSHEHELF